KSVLNSEEVAFRCHKVRDESTDTTSSRAVFHCSAFPTSRRRKRSCLSRGTSTTTRTTELYCPRMPWPPGRGCCRPHPLRRGLREEWRSDRAWRHSWSRRELGRRSR